MYKEKEVIQIEGSFLVCKVVGDNKFYFEEINKENSGLVIETEELMPRVIGVLTEDNEILTNVEKLLKTDYDSLNDLLVSIGFFERKNRKPVYTAKIDGSCKNTEKKCPIATVSRFQNCQDAIKEMSKDEVSVIRNRPFNNYTQSGNYIDILFNLEEFRITFIKHKHSDSVKKFFNIINSSKHIRQIEEFFNEDTPEYKKLYKLIFNNDKLNKDNISDQVSEQSNTTSELS